MTLHSYLELSARERPDHVALEEGAAASIRYDELAALSDALRDRLVHLGIGRGDRVGLCMRKSIDAVATIFGALKAGASYVPLDESAPPVRNAFILQQCGVKALVVEEHRKQGLVRELEGPGGTPILLGLEQVGGGKSLRRWLDAAQRSDPAPPVESAGSRPEDLAYVLYTSGSTGRPKGVMLSHRNATSFVEWCAETFQPRPEDRFSSHAPFHFDLSILDIYLSIKSGATLVLIPESVGKDPVSLAEFIAERGITIWYSAPSILAMLAQYGKLESHDYSGLRMILFAGEVFPVAHLRALEHQLPAPTYYNLYGPTETNVCTCHEIPHAIPEERSEPFPIGAACSHLRARVVDEKGNDVASGREGELCISGPSVMQGYWGLPDQTQRALQSDDSGRRWYRTGDVVVEDTGGIYRFVGRRDRMVKKRGYRVELGEIEACLYRHPEIAEVAAVALPDDEAGVVIRAHLSTRDGERLSIIGLKRFCSEQLPVYMVPDAFRFHPRLPKTSTDKIDYQTLAEEG
jgi:amino acid adenylation domain-containing protein